MQLAVFDLDGTITRHDTLIQYVLGYLKTRPWRVFGFLFAAPRVMLYLLRLSDRGALKASLIHWTLGGSKRATLDAYTERFVKKLLAEGCFRTAIDRIAMHRYDRDYLLLMSASPDIYVPFIGKQLGFDEVTCTGVRWKGERLHGALTTPNCRGEEKAVRFKAIRERLGIVRSVAYGNAASDLPHMRLADRGVLVNGTVDACRQAKELRVVCENWT